jgi:uncharacterized repeat protein (TIGR02543 family)
MGNDGRGNYSTSPGTPTRAGYTFNGWFTTTSGGQPCVSTHGRTDNFSLYAQWTANTYTVSYNGNSPTTGTAPASQTKIQGTALTLRTNTGTLAKTGYSFSGWNTSVDGTGTDYQLV